MIQATTFLYFSSVICKELLLLKIALKLTFNAVKYFLMIKFIWMPAPFVQHFFF